MFRFTLGGGLPGVSDVFRAAERSAREARWRLQGPAVANRLDGGGRVEDLEHVSLPLSLLGASADFRADISKGRFDGVSLTLVHPDATALLSIYAPEGERSGATIHVPLARLARLFRADAHEALSGLLLSLADRGGFAGGVGDIEADERWMPPESLREQWRAFPLAGGGPSAILCPGDVTVSADAATVVSRSSAFALLYDDELIEVLSKLQ